VRLLDPPRKERDLDGVFLPPAVGAILMSPSAVVVAVEAQLLRAARL
jgi:hypothetical protein